MNTQTKQKYVGQPTRRVDAREKVLGTAKYVGDYKVPNMLYARALRSEIPHARIVRLDVSPALEVPGVKAVIKNEDFHEHGKFGFPIQDQYALAYQKVRHVGEAIAAVAAETPEAALAGVRAIICELEPLPVVSDPTLALDPNAPQVGPDREDGKHYNFTDKSIVRKGDPEKTLKDCDIQFDQRFFVPHQDHAYMETEGVLAIPQPNGGVMAYVSNQSPFITSGIIASTLNMTEDMVRVILPPVGGSFGGKDDLNYYSAAQCSLLALKTGQPVRMTFSRDESMVASYKRDSMHMHIRLGADKDGTLKACKFDGILDSGAYASQSPFTGWRASIHAMGSYRYDDCHVDITGVYTNNSYCGAFRGFGNTEVCSGIERAIDEMAEKVGMDPIDFRLKNALRLNDEMPHGQVLKESVGLTECLEKTRQMSDWDRKRKEFPIQNEGSYLKRGIGVAALFHGVSLGAEGEDSAVSTVNIEHDNTVVLTSGLTDYGQGSRTVFTLIAAEELGISPDRIQILRPDTFTAFDSGPTVASRSTVLGGNATKEAAANVGQMLNFAAANMLKCEVDQIIRDDEAFIGPDEEPVDWDSVVNHARRMGLMLYAKSRHFSPAIHWDHHNGRGTPYFAYHFATQIIEVAVDTGTGKTDVTGIWAAHDAGKVIFPEGAYGQIYGGIAQGLGYALNEGAFYDDGYLQGTNFDEYLIPTSMDVPDIEAVFVDTYNTPGPYGAKNIAEPALVPTSPATLNAIYHATGRRIYELPASLEQVLLGRPLRKGDSTSCRLGLFR
jgi:CO/xanthine dehydrogenase Mo-binding subunit